ncbi:2-acylglycerol O-acyltransferase 2-A [Eumeta japonica]|uniref:Acyltransferase n=1 Tax=Eumeta variegata TaxID=151549 RepID=A0A4C1WD39_EUMVA|nr:2-acylglycerol O-acyltransferase 2-A [Eumeta japonica]
MPPAVDDQVILVPSSSELVTDETMVTKRSDFVKKRCMKVNVKRRSQIFSILNRDFVVLYNINDKGVLSHCRGMNNLPIFTKLAHSGLRVYRKGLLEIEEWLIPRIVRLFQAASAVSFVLMFSFLGFICIYSVIILLYSRYWYAILVYLWWAMTDTGVWYGSERRFEWVRNWHWWSLFRDYYPISLVKTADLDPSRNYLLACHPHGILPAGCFCAFATNALKFNEHYPGLKCNMATLIINFSVPFLRDLFLAMGLCPVSIQSLTGLLNPKKNKGRCVAILIGGAAETLETHPGTHKIILSKRKGFVRIAIMTGSPLVPVYSFGEVDTMPQLHNPPGSALRRFQEWFRELTGVSPVLTLGNGMKKNLGIVPLRVPIHVVVGAPIEVKQNPEPTPEEVDALHARYQHELVKLFDAHKHKYAANPENARLVVI